MSDILTMCYQCGKGNVVEVVSIYAPLYWTCKYCKRDTRFTKEDLKWR